jgi:hypothetical protein
VLDALHPLVLVVQVRHDALPCRAELGLDVALEALREVHRKHPLSAPPLGALGWGTDLPLANRPTAH